MKNDDSLPPPAAGAERHTLKIEEELRLEVGFSKTCNFKLTLVKGSAELLGVELALNQTYTLAADSGGLKLAIFTWHGCVVDVLVADDAKGGLDMSYTSDETNSNVAAVNTHAQLEAMRDEAVIAANNGTNGVSTNITTSGSSNGEGPRVMIIGPTESGKTSLAKLLTAYAVKLGRTPVLVDLDPADNCLTVPGAMAACIMDHDAVSLETYATTGLPVSSSSSQQSQPLVLWHGGVQLSPDLFREQVSALGSKIDQRLQHEDWARSSGLIVNTNGWIQEEGFALLVHAVKALRINVVLVLGHDRLYSMMKSAVAKESDDFNQTKVIKVPRSGGVVSREKSFLLQCRSRSIKRYFYGSMIEPTSTTAAAAPSASNATAAVASIHAHRVPQLTPFAVQLAFNKLTLYKFFSISLSASLLPVAAAQATEHVQLQVVEISEKLQHCLLAVCHPHAVATYEATGKAKDLYESGVAGFCVVERVLMESEMIHMLSPCAGNLPSHTLIVGDITWMD
jgi:polyribonucleotide 5'-hydroxyl-kinase